MTPRVFCELPPPDAAIAAARELVRRGFHSLEAYTPCQVPELETILARPRTRLPRATFMAGVCGLVVSYFILWYCNAHDYPLDVGGRPFNSIPADIPIMFETTVLFAGLTTFFVVVVRSGLPRLSNPLFELDGFDRVSNDRYWIGIDPKDHDPTELEEALHALDGATIHRPEGTS